MPLPIYPSPRAAGPGAVIAQWKPKVLVSGTFIAKIHGDIVLPLAVQGTALSTGLFPGIEVISTQTNALVYKVSKKGNVFIDKLVVVNADQGNPTATYTYSLYIIVREKPDWSGVTLQLKDLYLYQRSVAFKDTDAVQLDLHKSEGLVFLTASTANKLNFWLTGYTF